jgi:hypothetical protein
MPTYGSFTWDYSKKFPRFKFTRDGFQINLNSRLQIVEAFRKFQNTRILLFGSLFAFFPYTGEYGTSMWYINQIPSNPHYKDMDIVVQNMGGMKTRFWNWNDGPENNPFIHVNIPTNDLLENGFKRRIRGVHTSYPSIISMIGTTLGSLGVKVIDFV